MAGSGRGKILLRMVKKRIRQYLAYAGLRALTAVVLSLGVDRAVHFGRFCAGVVYRLDARHRRRALENLSAAMPEIPPAQRDGIARDSFCSFAQVLVESAYLPRVLFHSTWTRYMDVEMHPEAKRAMGAGKGGIMFTAHTGNWELTGQVAGAIGHPLLSVARPRDNPYLERHVIAGRERMGQKIVAKTGAVRDLSRALREGRFLGVLVDQNAGRQGILCDFFGRPASTTAAPAMLAIRFGAPLVPSHQRRIGTGFRYLLTLEAPLEVPRTGDREQDVKLLTTAMNARVEAWVRADPDQWLWAHRRWKIRKGVGS